MTLSKTLLKVFSSLLYLFIWIVHISTFILGDGIFFGIIQAVLLILLAWSGIIFRLRIKINVPTLISTVFSMIFFSNGFFVIITSLQSRMPLEIYNSILFLTSSSQFANQVYFLIFIIALYGNFAITKKLRAILRKHSTFTSISLSEIASAPMSIVPSDHIIILPAYNEEEEIGLLLDELTTFVSPNQILVVDNNSTDKTAEVAKAKGVTVISESEQGKACAIKTGLQYILQQDKYNYILMMDADGTYSVLDILRFIYVFLKYPSRDVIMGSRLRGYIEKGAMTPINKIGNIILSFIARELYNNEFSDICTGFWGFRRNAIQRLLEKDIDSKGFGLEAEMVSKFSKMGIPIVEVPISYSSRTNSQPKLNPVKDGLKIFSVLVKNRIRN